MNVSPEQEIEYFLQHSGSCRGYVLDTMFTTSNYCWKNGVLFRDFEFSGSKGYPYEGNEEFHDGNDAFEREWYETHSYVNWSNLPYYAPILSVPEDVSDEWRAVCIEYCKAVLLTPIHEPRIGLGFSYATGEMTRVMEHSRTDYEHTKPGIKDRVTLAEILCRLLSRA